MSSTSAAVAQAVLDNSGPLTAALPALAGAAVTALAVVLVILSRKLLKESKSAAKAEPSRETDRHRSDASDRHRTPSVTVNVTGNGNSSANSNSNSNAADASTVLMRTPLPITPAPELEATDALMPVPAVRDLTTHTFFDAVKRIKADRIEQIKCGPFDVRTKLMRDMCHDIVDAWEYGIENMLGNNKAVIEGTDGRKLRSVVSAALSAVDTEVVEKWRRRGAPNEAVESMKKWYTDARLVFRAWIDDAASSALSADNHHRMLDVIDIAGSNLESLFFGARYTLRNMNGKLSGRMYGNLMIEDCAPSSDKEDSVTLNIPVESPTPEPMPAIKKHRSGEYKASNSGKHRPQQ